MIKDFKDFILRGDVLTLAVAVIIGGAFGKIIDSLVADVITPILGMLTGGVNFSESFQFGAGEAKIKVGAFIQAVINFLTIGIVLFFLVKDASKNAEDVK